MNHARKRKEECMKTFAAASLLGLAVFSVASCSTSSGFRVPSDPWEQAQFYDSVDTYTRFATENPQSEHVTDAKRRIEALRFSEISREEYTDESRTQYWSKNLSLLARIEEAYRQFLADYPGSEFAPQVEARLQQLKQEEEEYRSALNASMSGDISGFLAFFSRYPNYDLTDILASLSKVGDDRCVKALGELLVSYDKEARNKTYPISVPGLVILGPSGDANHRIEILSALSGTRNTRALPYIIMSLDDPEKVVMTIGMSYNGGVTGPATYSYPVREAAHDALVQMTGKDFGMDPSLWKNWWIHNSAAAPL